MLKQLKEKRKMRALLLVCLLLVGVAAGASASLKPACERTIVSGSLVSDLDFRVTAIAVYASGMFSGNPVLAHVEGTVPGPGWYAVPLPGFRDPDHVRVRSGDAPVTAFFDEGDTLSYSVDDENATFPAAVTIDYIAGTAWWTNRFELDLDHADLTLIGRVHWQAEALFRDVDLLLVSGEVHTVQPNYDERSYGAGEPAASAVGGGWFSFSSSNPPSAPGLNVFTVPSSKDAGIYVVHRAERVDLPGAAGKDALACRTAGFSVRVYESPVNTTEFVVASFTKDSSSAGQAWSVDVPAGLPSYLAIGNAGAIPWVPGLVEVWKDGVLVGSDRLAYTPAGGEALIQTGTSFDVAAVRSIDVDNGTVFVNYTLRNVDAVPHRVELSDTRTFQNSTLPAPFVRVGDVVTAHVELAPQQEVTIGYTAAP